MRSTRRPTATLSTESRLTAERSGIGSSPGSSTTSLARPRMVVVQGPTTARRRRPMAASRERTTTGRRPMSGGSHHQTSPRCGPPPVMRTRPRLGMRRDLPKRRLHPVDARRTPHRRHRLRWNGGRRAGPQVPHRGGRRRLSRRVAAAPTPGVRRQPLCSPVVVSWHKSSISMPHLHLTARRTSDHFGSVRRSPFGSPGQGRSSSEGTWENR